MARVAEGHVCAALARLRISYWRRGFSEGWFLNNDLDAMREAHLQKMFAPFGRGHMLPEEG